jgi:pyruvate-formate lyase-activating enzyme
VTDPPRSSWLDQLHQILLRVPLPVRDLILTQRILSLGLALHPSRILTIEIRSRKSGDRCYAQTRRFSIGYQGQDELDPIEKQGLDKLVAALKRIEGKLPADLDGAAGVFDHTTPPAERFLRLFPFCTVERSLAGRTHITEVLVRTTSHCNQRCPFCTAPEHDTPSASVMNSLLRAVPEAFPGAMLSLTGGEPTLRPTFVREVETAATRDGISSVQVQTNAVLLGSKIDPSVITPRPHLSFFVSLHAIDPDLYDRCTGTSGQLPLALRGARRLFDAGHRVTVNCVVSAINIGHLADYARAWPTVLPVGDAIDWHFSTLICPQSRPEAAELLVPYPDLVQRVREAEATARQVGVAVQSLRASTHASVPACLLPAEDRECGAHRPVVLAHETGLPDQGRPWVKAATCKACVQTSSCLGVPRPYAARFGLDTLRPIRES